MEQTTETSNTQASNEPPQWTRAKDGVLGGVCTAVARKLELDPWVVRILWLITVCFLGSGLLLYVILVICLPREDDPSKGYRSKLLGVCSRVAKRVKLQPGLVRLIAVLLLFVSCGSALVAYIALAVLLPKDLV